MKHWCILICVLSMFACKPDIDKGEERNLGNEAEQEVSTDSSEDVLRALKGVSLETGLKITHDALKQNFDAGLDEKAVDIISNILYNFDNDEQIEAYTPVFLEQAKGKSGIENFYEALQAAYVTRYPQNKFSSSVTEVSTIMTLLDKKKDLIENPNFNRFSVQDATDYIQMTEAYMLISSKDEDAGSQLLTSGNLAKRIPGYAAKAVVLYDWLLQKQPNHPKANQALFLKAFTYDNELKKPEVAKKLYKEFIAKYPDDDFADDAQLLLDNVGKTDQEFYETIIKNKDKK